MMWALINLGNRIQKFKITNYEFKPLGEAVITTTDGNKYFTHMSNVVISDKEPIIKNTRNV